VHRRVYEEFERMLERYPPQGENALELGAVPTKSALLKAISRQNPDVRCVGVNLHVPKTHDPSLGFEMVQGNANDLSMFDDRSFDSVITNSMLEHDSSFWLTLGEVRRVLKPGGLFYVGVPGYKNTQNPVQKTIFRLGSSRYARIPGARTSLNFLSSTRLMGTGTFMFHLGPHDYWRFSPQAVEEVFFEGMECLSLSEVMSPIRIVAVGRKTPDPVV
jgi:ubiquinone/menaquinone biosynthesis C-methylase UbiE